MHQTLVSFLGSIRYPTFSPYLEQLQSCEDAEKQYSLLIKAIRSEPYLLARVVSLANSVMHGAPGRYFYTPEECLTRLGLSQGTRVAMTFFVEAALEGWLQHDERSQTVWAEAVVTAHSAKALEGLYTGPIKPPTSFLATLLSFLGELFLVGPVFDRLGPNVHLGFYAQGGPEELDPYVLTKLLLKKMALPRPVEASLLQITRLGDPMGNPEARVAAAIVVAVRGLAQANYPSGAFIARVDQQLVQQALDVLSFDETKLAQVAASNTRAQLADYTGAS